MAKLLIYVFIEYFLALSESIFLFAKNYCIAKQLCYVGNDFMHLMFTSLWPLHSGQAQSLAYLEAT